MRDPLTDMNDRETFFEGVQRQVISSHDDGSRFAILIIDIDRFARINQMHGFRLGDAVLVAVGQALQTVARPKDLSARLGDNRYGLLLRNILNDGHALLAGYKILRALETPMIVEGKAVPVRVTVGISACPTHGTHGETLIKAAEEALRIARRKGTRVEIAPSRDPDIVPEGWLAEIELEDALSRDELRLCYQPKINLRTGKPAGAEALMRWNSRSLGEVRPDVFIPIAEKSGAIKKMVAWSLNRALREATQWPDDWDGLSVAINVPPSLVSEPDFPDLVKSALNIWSAKGSVLTVEITERSLLASDQTAYRNLRAVQEMGASVSIDDFGTGYSCLAYFKDIPVDEVKIDQSFVATMLEDRASADLVEVIIDLAHRFGLRTVAEGVETHAVAQALRERDCDQIQGFLLGPALEQADFVAWIREGGWARIGASVQPVDD
ncbi:MAG: bifunctional diguanylate cyclase/phosphodiesterase [Chromatiales bacterium]